MKSLSKILIFLFIISIIPSGGPAVADTGLSVDEAAIALGIEDRTPVGSSESFSADVGKVYCYTRISGGQTGDYVRHVWYYEDREMAQVELSIGTPLFRTYSSKNILPSWTGQWKVEIVALDGTVLDTLSFTIE